MGLSMNSVKVHLTAITDFHPPIKGFSVFTHSTMMRFLKCLFNLFTYVREATLLWDLNSVLSALRKKKTFQILGEFLFLHLSFRISFLVALCWKGRRARSTSG